MTQVGIAKFVALSGVASLRAQDARQSGGAGQHPPDRGQPGGFAMSTAVFVTDCPDNSNPRPVG